MSVNQLSNVWDDGSAFRPERWLEPNGWSNILSFSMGPRLCMGYKLVFLELKSLTTSTLMRAFAFRATGEIENKMIVVLQTRIVGLEEKGV
ncbi:hypothetical protein NEOLEDRAFT_1091661 [Neolentinus lepideus HHB14362 ss-1]|uniref:Cytochrome P450 n=1 Tax=Neolentinus lepideus HHB14362 ss-1 TaxID=1314782 RepID=A0A165T4U2_9AGAM|nr:hypothetical protein NEOLEDRAFT_1091661 [Neolentinus lepideus HHB14362 ss-1]